RENAVTATQLNTEATTATAPLSSHISELRHALLTGITAWLCVLAVLAFYYHPLLELILEPYQQAAQKELSVATYPLNARATQIVELRNTSPDPVWQHLEDQPLAMDSGVEQHGDKYMLPPGAFLLVSQAVKSQPLVLSPAEGFGATLRICL